MRITGNEPSVFARFVPFVGYYLLGYLLRDTRLSRRGLAWCWVGLIATVLTLALGTGLLVKLTGGAVKWYPSVNMILYDFLSPVRIVINWVRASSVARSRPRSGKGTYDTSNSMGS